MSTSIAKLLAFALWADGKITESELDSLKPILSKYNIDKQLIQAEIDLLLGGEEIDSIEEVDIDIDLGQYQIEDIDEYDLLRDIATVIIADKVLDMAEIDAMHTIGNALQGDPQMGTAAIVQAIDESKIAITIQEED
jgi:hypothetical protein